MDFAQLVKEFGSEGGEEARRYAPPRLIGAEKIAVQGDPDEARICTSHVERANWTLRGHLRRMTRLSNGFSRKRANLRAALALYFAYYILCRMHGSVRMTPAMAAGVTRKPWTLATLMPHYHEGRSRDEVVVELAREADRMQAEDRARLECFRIAAEPFLREFKASGIAALGLPEAHQRAVDLALRLLPLDPFDPLP